MSSMNYDNRKHIDDKIVDSIRTDNHKNYTNKKGMNNKYTNKKIHVNDSSFKNVYIMFGIAFIITCMLYMSFIIFIDILTTKIVMMATFIFIMSLLIIGVLFIFTLKNKISKVFNLLDEMISGAINEEKMINKYDETLLSSLESKIFRYIKITKSNKEAIEKEKNKVNSLVSDISHQTKTPISNILLYSQLALENPQIDDYTKEILGDIQNQSERLNFLIQSLIKMSRLENGIIKPNKDKVSIKDVISKSIQEVYINANHKEIDINVNCDKNIKAHIDIKWTVEAVVNILENAIKYTKNKGSIEISVNEYELFKRIDIKDNGIGIDEEEINNIFKRFYRCKNAKTYEGVGIGLFLAREIIHSQGGYIKASSEIGKGSTFSIFLPS